MNKLLSVVALGLLVVACVPHDPDEVTVEPVYEEEWQPVKLQQPIPPQEIQVQPVVVRPVERVEPARTVVVEQPKQTWWKTNRPVQKIRVVAPACPCADPNDPCPQCYEK